MTESVYLVVYRRQHEGAEVHAVCESERVARTLAAKLQRLHRKNYGFDHKAESFLVESWIVLGKEDVKRFKA